MPRAVFAALVCLSTACGGPAKYAVVGSPLASATDGLLQVETIEGGQQMLTLVLDRLPPASRMAEEATVYVGWLVSGEDVTTSVGALEYDAETRQGRLTATTSLTTFTLVVTAEASATPSSPSDRIVADRFVGERPDAGEETAEERERRERRERRDARERREEMNERDRGAGIDR